MDQHGWHDATAVSLTAIACALVAVVFALFHPVLAALAGVIALGCGVVALLRLRNVLGVLVLAISLLPLGIVVLGYLSLTGGGAVDGLG